MYYQPIISKPYQHFAITLSTPTLTKDGQDELPEEKEEEVEPEEEEEGDEEGDEEDDDAWMKDV